MAFLHLQDISLAFGDRDILKNINLNINNATRMALSGPNGSGKSTFLKVLGGLQEPDGGKVHLESGALVSYLPQSGILHKGRTLNQEADTAYERFHAMESELQDIGIRLESAPEEEQGPLLERHHNLHEALIQAEYYHRERHIARVLKGLGFSDEDMERETSAFSGGWQMRIALSKTLLQRPDIALLDEPTNYLDLEARDWLIRFIESYSGGILVVSHDRHFLDSVVSDVAELFLGELRTYKGNYTSYEKRRKLEMESLLKRYQSQQEEIERHEAFIRRFRYSANRAAQVQSRVKVLEKMERVEIPPGMKKMKLSFPPPPHCGKEAVTLDHLGRSYGDKKVFSGLDLTIPRGKKMAVTGVNGAGKSTLLRILSGQDHGFKGAYKLGKDVKIGYFSQDMEDLSASRRSVLEEIEESAPTSRVSDARSLLGAFLFTGDDVFKQLSVLSGGERSRVALLKLLLRPVNLLILDEPTNHLDIHSKDILLQALSDYSGTVIFVSHDRYFIEKLADSVLDMAGGRGTFYPGDYTYFLSRKEGSEDEGPQAEEQTKTKETTQLSFEEQKKRRAETGKLERQRDKVWDSIEKIEEELARIGEELAKPENYSDADKSRELQRLQDEADGELHRLTEEWEALEEQLAEYAE